MGLLDFLTDKKKEKFIATETLLIFHNGEATTNERIEGILPLEEGDNVLYFCLFNKDMQGEYRVVKGNCPDRLVSKGPDATVNGSYIRQINLEKT